MSQLSKMPVFSKRLAAAVLLLLVAVYGRAEPLVGLTLDPQHVGAEIPADFVGLSFEMQRVLPDTNGYHFFSTQNKPLIATFKTLGIKNLRVGGNTADRPTLPVPGKAEVDELFAFAKAADVKVIYTLRLNQGTPAAAAAMADYILQHYGAQLDCFAIGNEPNVFSTNFDVYLTEWKRYAAEITASTNSPGAKFCGPSVSPGHEKWSAQFARDLAGSGLLKYISQHDYAGGDGRKVTNAAIARDRILSPAMAAHYEKFAANFVPTILSNGLAYRFEEANSFYDGGALDVSDTFASALWALNYQWWWAEHGMSGINFHTGDKVAARDENKPCRYASFWTVPNGFNIHPVGYAEKMFSLGSRGKIIPVGFQTQTDTNLNFTAHAVQGDDGNCYVTLINFSHGGTATNYSMQITVAGAKGYLNGEIIRLATADGDVARKSGVTIGGVEIRDNASWAGRWKKIGAPHKNQLPVIVELPAASAVVVKLRPL